MVWYEKLLPCLCSQYAIRWRHIGQSVFIGFLLASLRRQGSQNICLQGIAAKGSWSKSKHTGQIRLGSKASNSGSASKISWNIRLYNVSGRSNSFGHILLFLSLYSKVMKWYLNHLLFHELVSFYFSRASVMLNFMFAILAIDSKTSFFSSW